MITITEQPWKNLQGIRMENDALRIMILPQLGGKIASFYCKKRKFELAAQTGKESYDLPGPDEDFSAYDASGLDDAFPNIDAGVLQEHGVRWKYPDHGEIWSSCFSWKAEEQEVILNMQSRKFPYTYEKRIRLEDKKVILGYRICNTGAVSFPCIWTFHGLFRYEEEMRFLYPGQMNGFENVLNSPELGSVGNHILLKDKRYDFSKVPVEESGTMVKYYIDDKVAEGFCGYYYPRQGVKCLFTYDSEKLPYLGVWITAGGYRGDYNCALEPSNGYYDGIQKAKENQALYELKPGEPLVFTLQMKIKEDSKR